MERVTALILILCILLCGCKAEKTPESKPETKGKIREESRAESEHGEPQPQSEKKDFVKWAEFNCSAELLKKASAADVRSEGEIDWITVLAYSVAKNWGNADKKCLSYADECIERLKKGGTEEDFSKELKLFDYYKEVYTAVLGGFLGIRNDETYGFKVYSPIADGFYFTHYKDFGASRSYGFSRPHKGNDLLGTVGTPVICIEDGYAEALGWNQYGGWRIGIRSNDKKRYYYYAHLRKGHPFAKDLKEGDSVRAGQVIGYLGQTGYSTKPNANNISIPHLHFGMQLIFDESQKDAVSEIWIDVYAIIELLNQSRSEVKYDKEAKEYYRVSVP